MELIDRQTEFEKRMRFTVTFSFLDGTGHTLFVEGLYEIEKIVMRYAVQGIAVPELAHHDYKVYPPY